MTHISIHPQVRTVFRHWVRAPLLLALYFYLLVIVMRLFFLGCQADYDPDITWSGAIKTLVYAIRLDASAIAYLMAVPVLLLPVLLSYRAKALRMALRWWVILLTMLYILIAVGESVLYREWHTKLNVQAVSHFSHPSEVFSTARWSYILLFFFSVFALSFIFIRLLNRLVMGRIGPVEGPLKRPWMIGISLIIYLMLTAYAARGGLRPIPISVSDAYFSKSNMLNDAAVNPLWAFAHEVVEQQYHMTENPFQFMDDQSASAVVDRMNRVEKDSTIHFLTLDKPNIVYIILESWSANCVKSFGGDNFAPFVDSLSRTGIRFTNLFASAYVSDQGIPAILSGYPSAPRIAIINYPPKVTSLPCVNKDLEKIGYNSAFYFGGDLNYGNIRAYLIRKQFDLLKEEKDFPSSLPRGQLGLQDDQMARLFLDGLNRARSPFFYCWFTLSTHEPFDIPVDIKPLVDHKENPYVNTVVFSDQQLQWFFHEARKQPWYRNTLFVLTADHSRSTHRKCGPQEKDFNRIPVMFVGDVIDPAWRGRTVDRISAQTDITPTILHQLNLDASQYRFGHDLFNPHSPHFAYFPFFWGGTYLDTTGTVCFKKEEKGIIVYDSLPGFQRDSICKRGRCLQQEIYGDYMRR